MAKYRGSGSVGGAPNMNNLMKQAQKMQEEAARLTMELQNQEFSGSAGGGAVTAVVTGAKTVKSLTISPDAVDPEETEMLADMIVAAVNEALRIADETASAKMGALTGGMKLPGM